MSEKNNNLTKNNKLYNKIALVIDLARKQVATTANLAMVHSYFEIGRMIVEDEMKGEQRAKYGKQVLKELSIKLNNNFGKGFSEPNLRNMRKFYLAYSDRLNKVQQMSSDKLKKRDNSIQQTASTEFQVSDNHLVIDKQPSSLEFKNFTLSWSHYLVLMRIENLDERNFYEIEAFKEQWSEKHLKRQYHSSMYEKLFL